MIATVDDLEAIAGNDKADVPALQGWRRKLFGARALELKRGELALDGRKRQGRRARMARGRPRGGAPSVTTRAARFFVATSPDVVLWRIPESLA